MGLSHDAEVLRVALRDILGVLGCDGAQVVLHPFGGRSGIVATVGAGMHNGAVWARRRVQARVFAVAVDGVSASRFCAHQIPSPRSPSAGGACGEGRRRSV